MADGDYPSVNGPDGLAGTRGSGGLTPPQPNNISKDPPNPQYTPNPADGSIAG